MPIHDSGRDGYVLALGTIFAAIVLTLSAVTYYLGQNGLGVTGPIDYIFEVAAIGLAYGLLIVIAVGLVAEIVEQYRYEA